MLQIIDRIPDGFLDVSAVEIQQLLSAPTLIHLQGNRPRPVFVSILLHGNEDVGLKAVQQVLRAHQPHGLPRSLSIFVGNVTAAAQGVRRLPGQPDYNRIWPGSPAAGGEEARMMREVVEEMRCKNVFVSIDLHNNTGTNPYYACVCSTANEHLQLASLFSRTVVYFTQPAGVQNMAFMNLCPSITCECGKVGDPGGVTHAADLLTACLHLAEFPHQDVPPGDVHLFHTVATVKVPENVTIGFGEETADLVFPEDLDRWNFNEIGPGAEIACRTPGSQARLQVFDVHGTDRHADYINVSGNSLRLKKRLLPSMLTLDRRVIRQDCLCYFMERYDDEPPRPV